MSSPRETALAALHARAQTLAAPILRGDVLPERVPAAGLLILRDGEPGEGAPAGSWLDRMMARKPKMLVAVVLANRMARTAWTMLRKGEDYRDPAMTAA